MNNKNPYLPKYGVTKNRSFLSNIVFSRRKYIKYRTNSKDKHKFDVVNIDMFDTYFNVAPKLIKLAIVVQESYTPNPFRTIT